MQDPAPCRTRYFTWIDHDDSIYNTYIVRMEEQSISTQTDLRIFVVEGESKGQNYQLKVQVRVG